MPTSLHPRLKNSSESNSTGPARKACDGFMLTKSHISYTGRRLIRGRSSRIAAVASSTSSISISATFADLKELAENAKVYRGWLPDIAMETAGDTEKGVLRSDWIGPEPEEGLLRAGLLQLAEAIGTERLLEFPRRANGTPLLTRQGFFERLLKGEDGFTSLLDCAAADASAAEADVKRLGLHQLLAIRRAAA
eukprot:s2417_g15.t1